MRKGDLIYNIGIVFMLIAIFSLIIFKFVIKENKNGIEINIEKLIVSDLNGNKIKFSDILMDDISYCLFFDMNDCHSCILKGLNDLSELKKNGINSMAFVIHHRFDEIVGWSKNYDFSPFFMINKKDFYLNINSHITPAIIKINRGEVENFRYIVL